MAVLNALVTALLGAALSLATLATVRGLLPKRTNFAGRDIPTAAGVVLLPAVFAAFFFGGLPYAAYLFLAVGVGFLDDVFGDGGSRGFRGHVGALLGGRLTTGMVKVVSLGGGALAVGLWLFGWGFSAFAAAFILAGWANLGNLFDVRPGRAIKFTLLPALLFLPAASADGALSVAAVAGGVISLFYSDVKGRIMLGDAGAAACGSVAGLVVVSGGPGVAWLLAGLAVAALTLVAEFFSISRVIERVEALRWLDLWGRARDG